MDTIFLTKKIIYESQDDPCSEEFVIDSFYKDFPSDFPHGNHTVCNPFCLSLLLHSEHQLMCSPSMWPRDYNIQAATECGHMQPRCGLMWSNVVWVIRSQHFTETTPIATAVHLWLDQSGQVVIPGLNSAKSRACVQLCRNWFMLKSISLPWPQGTGLCSSPWCEQSGHSVSLRSHSTTSLHSKRPSSNINGASNCNKSLRMNDN